MLANYGYQDGSGAFFVTIDTDRCDGCGDCVTACPARVFETGDDPGDPFREEPVARVCDAHRNRLKVACGPCKPASSRPGLPCVVACAPGAITHSW
jgi:NAD-dependent dihydropyrimidine dehydrogenase PreA subunit